MMKTSSHSVPSQSQLILRALEYQYLIPNTRSQHQNTRLQTHTEKAQITKQQKTQSQQRIEVLFPFGIVTHVLNKDVKNNKKNKKFRKEKQGGHPDVASQQHRRAISPHRIHSIHP
jgi:hypothetical protein